jgi:hypothetical protein
MVHAHAGASIYLCCKFVHAREHIPMLQVRAASSCMLFGGREGIAFFMNSEPHAIHAN